jgi:hypothetical protein
MHAPMRSNNPLSAARMNIVSNSTVGSNNTSPLRSIGSRVRPHKPVESTNNAAAAGNLNVDLSLVGAALYTPPIAAPAAPHFRVRNMFPTGRIGRVPLTSTSNNINSATPAGRPAPIYDNNNSTSMSRMHKVSLAVTPTSPSPSDPHWRSHASELAESYAHALSSGESSDIPQKTSQWSSHQQEWFFEEVNRFVTVHQQQQHDQQQQQSQSHLSHHSSSSTSSLLQDSSGSDSPSKQFDTVPSYHDGNSPHSPEDMLLHEQVQAQLDGYSSIRPSTPPNDFNDFSQQAHRTWPSSLQPRGERGRVAAASLRPFTPNVAPVAPTEATVTPLHRPLHTHSNQQQQIHQHRITGGTLKNRPWLPTSRTVVSVLPKGNESTSNTAAPRGKGRPRGVKPGSAPHSTPSVISASLSSSSSHTHQHQHQRPTIVNESNNSPGSVRRSLSAVDSASAAVAASTSMSVNGEEEVSLLYDPILNSYYDPNTHIYYELNTS